MIQQKLSLFQCLTKRAEQGGGTGGGGAADPL